MTNKFIRLFFIASIIFTLVSLVMLIMITGFSEKFDIILKIYTAEIVVTVCFIVWLGTYFKPRYQKIPTGVNMLAIITITLAILPLIILVIPPSLYTDQSKYNISFDTLDRR